MHDRSLRMRNVVHHQIMLPDHNSMGCPEAVAENRCTGVGVKVTVQIFVRRAGSG